MNNFEESNKLQKINETLGLLRKQIRDLKSDVDAANPLIELDDGLPIEFRSFRSSRKNLRWGNYILSRLPEINALLSECPDAKVEIKCDLSVCFNESKDDPATDLAWREYFKKKNAIKRPKVKDTSFSSWLSSEYDDPKRGTTMLLKKIRKYVNANPPIPTDATPPPNP